MKKTWKLITAIVLAGCIAGCSSGEERTNTITTTEKETIQAKKILVTYFSVMETDGTDTVSGASRLSDKGRTMGNTEYVASLISQELQVDEVVIETESAYPTTHDALLEIAADEKSRQDYPKLKTEIPNFEEYDTIFVGYPNWNGDLPMPLYSFFEQYDFSSKVIIPFNTHGGSGFSDTISTIANLEPKASVVSNGLSISRNDVAASEQEVQAWLKELNIR